MKLAMLKAVMLASAAMLTVAGASHAQSTGPASEPGFTPPAEPS